MGLFSKKPKPPKTKAEPATEDRPVLRLREPTKGELDLKEGEIRVTDKGLISKLPKGLDPNNHEQVKEFVARTLAEAGILPKGATVSSMEVVPIPSDGSAEDFLNKLLEGRVTSAEGEATQVKKAVTCFKAMEGRSPDPLPVPDDAAKAAFITALNRLHKLTHELAPLTADVYTSIDCLRMSLDSTNPDVKARARFEAFEHQVIKLVESMSNFGSEVCDLTVKVGRRGIPAPDGPNLSVN